MCMGLMPKVSFIVVFPPSSTTAQWVFVLPLSAMIVVIFSKFSCKSTTIFDFLATFAHEINIIE